MSSDIWIEGKEDMVMGVTARSHGPVEFTIFEPRDEAEIEEPVASWFVTAPSRADRYTLFEMARVAAEYANGTPGKSPGIDVPEWNEGEVEETTHSAIVGRDEEGEYLHTLNLFGRNDGTLQMILADSGLVFRVLEDPVDADNPDGRIQVDDLDELGKLVGFLEHRVDVFEGKDWRPDDDEDDEEG